MDEKRKGLRAVYKMPHSWHALITSLSCAIPRVIITAPGAGEHAWSFLSTPKLTSLPQRILREYYFSLLQSYVVLIALYLIEPGYFPLFFFSDASPLRPREVLRIGRQQIMRIYWIASFSPESRDFCRWCTGDMSIMNKFSIVRLLFLSMEVKFIQDPI